MFAETVLSGHTYRSNFEWIWNLKTEHKTEFVKESELVALRSFIKPVILVLSKTSSVFRFFMSLWICL